jgi:hypothetical protein
MIKRPSLGVEDSPTLLPYWGVPFSNAILIDLECEIYDLCHQWQVLMLQPYAIAGGGSNWSIHQQDRYQMSQYIQANTSNHFSFSYYPM